MDGKVAAILILSILILLMAVFGVYLITKSWHQNTGHFSSLKDFTVQEKHYSNENQTALLGKDNRSVSSAASNTGKNNPQNSNKLQKAVLLFETEQFPQALQILADLKINALDDETSAAAYYYMAATLHKLGKDKKALVFLKRITGTLKQTKWTTKAVILLGQINRKYQFSDQSLEVYLHKLYMESSNSDDQQEILTQLGYLKLYRDDYSGAMDQFQKAGTVLARLGQARIHVKKNEYWKAINIYEDILNYKNYRNQPYYNDVKQAFLKQTYYYAKQWLHKQNYNHAYFYFRKIVNGFPNSLYGEASLFWLGEMFQLRKAYTTAIRYYNMTLANKNRNKDDAALFKRGIAYYHLKQYAKSIKDFKRLAEHYPHSAYLTRARQWSSMAERELTYR